MIHTLNAKARGLPVTSVGSLLDEPFTGVLYLESSSITSEFTSLKGKRIGYVGEFGKIEVDELTKHYGMNVAKSIIEGKFDAGIGIECFQQFQLKEYLKGRGGPASDAKMLIIDK